MARLTIEQKELILADFHTGQFSQRNLSLKYECSTATINKLTKGIKPKNKDKVNTLSTIQADLMLQSEQEVNAVSTEVNKRVQHLNYFQDSALTNQRKANILLEESDKMSEIKDHATITKTNKETVLGKEPETVINNANVQTTNNLEWEILN